MLSTASFVIKNNQNELISAIVLGLEDGIPYVISLVTHPTQRGKQLAEDLLNLSMNQLIGNYNELVLYVNEENVGAIRLYERLGFIVEGKQ